jgi:ABC-2 type transport system ATP-binding protein
MIKVTNIRMLYGDFEALKGVSFEIPKGVVVGLLGPNGAGKSTLIKILMGLQPPFSGTASIGGFDVQEESLLACSQVGYLPEHNALYEEMRVGEYLEFIASIRRVPLEKREENIEKALKRTDLLDRRNQIIATLSKGLKQRTGIASTLVSLPPVILLDEPTIGLDPKQIQEIRDLIIDLSNDHTVMFSTHILPEVEMCCSRVIIISEGNIVADDSLENLTKGSSIILKLGIEENSGTAMLAQLEKIEGISSGEIEKEDTGILFDLQYKGEYKQIADKLFQFLKEKDIPLYQMMQKRPQLEEIFMERAVLHPGSYAAERAKI